MIWTLTNIFLKGDKFMDIMNLSAEELVLIDTLKELAKEAIEASKLIEEKFNSSFGIKQKEIHVYHTESFGEYYGDGFLTIDGIFKYHDNWWGGRDYSFSCDTSDIYKMLRSCYLKKIGITHLDPEKFECNIENIDTYFRDFIKEISK